MSFTEQTHMLMIIWKQAVNYLRIFQQARRKIMKNHSMWTAGPRLEHALYIFSSVST